MATWFECKFKYNRENQDGGFTTVTEIYLVDAVSFTDAETRVYQEIGSNYQEFVLLKVAKFPFQELIHNESGFTWYKCKVSITSLDEKSGKEKKLKQTIMVNANNLREAYDSVEELFSGSISDYEILDIVTTSIVEILPYIEDDHADPQNPKYTENIDRLTPLKDIVGEEAVSQNSEEEETIQNEETPNDEVVEEDSDLVE